MVVARDSRAGPAHDHHPHVRRWRRLDPTLQSLAVMVAASRIGCTWCMDFGYWEAHHRGVDPAKVSAVPEWRASDLYTEVTTLSIGTLVSISAHSPTVWA